MYRADIQQDYSTSPLLATEDFTTVLEATQWVIGKLEQYRGTDDKMVVSHPLIPFVRRSVSIVDTNGKLAANQFGMVTEYGKA